MVSPVQNNNLCRICFIVLEIKPTSDQKKNHRSISRTGHVAPSARFYVVENGSKHKNVRDGVTNPVPRMVGYKTREAGRLGQPQALAVVLSFCHLLGLGCPKQAFAKIATTLIISFIK